MKICGIVAEYNPFHTGHFYHIQQTRKKLKDECAIVCVMSGNYVQRGSPAIFPKHVRTMAALQHGVDLVLELPLMWSLASADRFAKGAIEILHQTGVVQWISFGSECCDLSLLQKIAQKMNTMEVEQLQLQWIASGMSTPAAKQKAAEYYLGEESTILKKPNGMLAIAYLRAMEQLNVDFQPVVILRQGVSHDANTPSKTFASASYLRKCWESGEEEKRKPFLPPNTWKLWDEAVQKGEGPVFLEHGAGERAILACLRSMDREAFQTLPETGGGLSDRIWKAVQYADSVSDVLQKCKTKRYTYAHLRRSILRAYLGITSQDQMEHVPYLRVLGFSERGQKILSEMREKAKCPVIVKFADGVRQGGVVGHQLRLEAHATNLYGLCTPKILQNGLEWRKGICRVNRFLSDEERIFE